VFAASQLENQELLRRKITAAVQLLPKVQLSPQLLDLITQICTDFAVDGHRADITMYKAACTLAAYKGRTDVNEEDVKEAAELVLPHRQRRQPFEEPHMEQQQVQDSIQKWKENKQPLPQESDASPNSNDEPLEQEEPLKEQVFQADKPYAIKPLSAPVLDEIQRHGSGRRSKTLSDSKKGRYVSSTLPKGKVEDLAFDATLRAAAPFQKRRREQASGQTALLIEKTDLREKVRETKMGNLIVFVVDASGSMAAEERMCATKGAVLSLLLDAYQRRDRVGMVTFRRDSAELVLPPTNSVELAQKYLTKLPTGGRTPLAHGLKLGMETAKHWMRNDDAVPLLVLVSDGRANVNFSGGDPVDEAKCIAREIASEGIQSIAVDTERDFISFGLVKQISEAMGAKYLRLEELSAAPIASAVRGKLFHDPKIAFNN
jgi:magnesium chelatase subunit D